MDILYVTHFNPWDPKYGAALRSYGILKGLNQKYTLHTVLAANDTQEIEGFLKGTDGFKRLHVLREPGEASPTRGASRAPGSYRKQFLALLEQVQPDLVWYFTKYALRRVGTPKRTPFVLDLDDVPWRKMLLTGRHQKGLQKVQTYGKVLPSWLEDSWLARRANALVITNAEEKELLSSHRAVTALPNGFEFPALTAFHQRSAPRVLFFGSLFYYPNLDGLQWLCQEIWPKVLKAVPDAQLDVVGLYKPEELGLPETPGVKLHGFVDNLDPFIDESAFLVVPLRIATGTRIKILEAWSKGLPVVSTTLGAGGLGAKHGETILCGDTVDEFADACIRLLKRPEEGVELARRAYNHGKSCFSWENIYPTMEKVITETIGR
jgi:polysaccharide biosynthesis protein PslH